MASFWLMVLLSLPAQGQQVLIVKSQITPIHEEVIRGIRTSLESLSHPLTVAIRDVDDVDRGVLSAPSIRLVIVLGDQAARKLPPIEKPVLYTLIPQHFYESLMACEIPCQENTQKDAHALYLDQPIERILNLLRLVLPHASTVGIIAGPFSSHKLKELQRIARQKDLNLLHRTIENEKQLAPTLNALLQEIDVLLALPDPMIHNRNTVPHLLLTTYRYSVPVIGFSRAYVTAGAIAAVYSTPAQMARQISDFTSQFISPGQRNLPGGSYYPAHFSIAVNSNVAQSMGLSLPDPTELETKLRKMQKAR